jgi:hypothetical protein
MQDETDEVLKTIGTAAITMLLGALLLGMIARMLLPMF